MDQRLKATTTNPNERTYNEGTSCVETPKTLSDNTQDWIFVAASFENLTLETQEESKPRHHRQSSHLQQHESALTHTPSISQTSSPLPSPPTVEKPIQEQFHLTPLPTFSTNGDPLFYPTSLLTPLPEPLPESPLQLLPYAGALVHYTKNHIYEPHSDAFTSGMFEFTCSSCNLTFNTFNDPSNTSLRSREYKCQKSSFETSQYNFERKIFEEGSVIQKGEAEEVLAHYVCDRSRCYGCHWEAVMWLRDAREKNERVEPGSLGVMDC